MRAVAPNAEDDVRWNTGLALRDWLVGAPEQHRVFEIVDM